MTKEDDARQWLRGNGYDAVAARIDHFVSEWRKRGVQTRRNWWDVLAGTEAGQPRKIEGESFPILAAARRRKGWAKVRDEVGRAGEKAPSVIDQERWNKVKSKSKKPRSKATKRKPVVASEATKRPPTASEPRAETKANKVNSTGSLTELTIENFAQLENVRIPLRDLVVLVGPQGTGKSLTLELLKLAIDRNRIVRFLKLHGFKWDTAEEFAGLYFGGGFESSWDSNTQITYGGERLSLDAVARARAYKGEDAVFYIPAHRTLAIAEGWPRAFSSYQVETPYVARRFSEELLTAINQGMIGKGKIFPHDRRLKDAFRKLIDDAIFHGGTLKLDTLGMRKQFVLEYDSAKASPRLPYMAWTAGQREFTPLLLGLYHLLPAGRGPKKREIQWAIIEEPEMGLHPKAVVAVMAVVLDLLARGYKVALSTHSPTVLEVVWGMSRLREVKDGATRLCRMLGLPEKEKGVYDTAAKALKKLHAVVHLQHEANGRVISKDISGLDPGAADAREWEWGGLVGFSARVTEAIAKSRAV